MNSFHTDPVSEANFHQSGALWRPVQPPRRGASEDIRAEFHAYVLLPGLSVAFHASTLKRSRTSIATYKRQAQQAAKNDANIGALILAQLGALSAEDGLQMARLRGRTQMPHFSLLAMCEYRERGLSRREIAAAFRCSPGTVASALQSRNRSYAPLSGKRRLTSVQQNPPGQFSSRLGS